MAMLERGEQTAVQRWRALETVLVAAVAAHSLAVGAMLVLVPEWAVRFAGWPGAAPLFFPRQAGVFHFVVVFGYLLELFRYRGVTLLVVTKTIACIFLVGAWAAGEQAWSVPFSGFADGLMGLVVGLAHRAARRAQAQASTTAG